MEIKQFIEENIENMKADLAKLVSYNSVNSNDELPFGSNNRKVLDEALKLMEEKGLKTNNVDYYCGFGETGKGDKLIGILAHLDIVPAGDGWNSNPFEMIEKDGFLYGRGVSDDKGAAVASMYALKYLIDESYDFKKKVRLILGCNEETGSRCIAYYVSKYGQIDYGFTPDGSFPGIYAEKGMVGASIIGHTNKIIDIEGGQASNVVMKKVDVKLANDSFDIDKFKKYLDSKDIEYEININDNTQIIVYGVAAHASMPDMGINALQYCFEALYHSDFNDPFIDWFHKYFSLDVHGETLGYESLKDDISNTSINLGVVKKENDDVIISLDMRFPVKAKTEDVVKLLNVSNEYGEIKIRNTVDPLYFDINSPMIKALKKAYEDVTNDKQTPMEAIGGGTYAKAINNCIAFGCEFIGENNHIHDANESLKIENFKKQVELYVQAIKNLNEIED